MSLASLLQMGSSSLVLMASLIVMDCSGLPETVVSKAFSDRETHQLWNWTSIGHLDESLLRIHKDCNDEHMFGNSTNILRGEWWNLGDVYAEPRDESYVRTVSLLKIKLSLVAVVDTILFLISTVVPYAISCAVLQIWAVVVHSIYISFLISRRVVPRVILWAVLSRWFDTVQIFYISYTVFAFSTGKWEHGAPLSSSWSATVLTFPIMHELTGKQKRAALFHSMFQKILKASLLIVVSGMLLLTHDVIPIYDLFALREKRKQGSTCNRHYSAATNNSNPAPLNMFLQSNWLVASAAVNHLTGDLNILTGYTPRHGDQTVHVPHMGPMKVHGSGSVNTHNIVLQNVWYVPGLKKNLVSAGQLTKLGCKVSFGSYGCRISKDGDDNVVGKARFTDEFQFEVEFVKVPPSAN